MHALEDPELYGIDDSPEGLAAVLAAANSEVCNLAALRERLAGHVVPLVGVTAHPVTGHPQWIVMKLVDTTLDKHVTRAKPWLHSLWRLLCDVLRGLADVHSLPGIYRDLKGDNVGVMVEPLTALLLDAGSMKLGA